MIGKKQHKSQHYNNNKHNNMAQKWKENCLSYLDCCFFLLARLSAAFLTLLGNNWAEIWRWFILQYCVCVKMRVHLHNLSILLLMLWCRQLVCSLPSHERCLKLSSTCTLVNGVKHLSLYSFFFENRLSPACVKCLLLVSVTAVYAFVAVLLSALCVCSLLDRILRHSTQLEPSKLLS